MNLKSFVDSEDETVQCSRSGYWSEERKCCRWQTDLGYTSTHCCSNEGKLCILLADYWHQGLHNFHNCIFCINTAALLASLSRKYFVLLKCWHRNVWPVKTQTLHPAIYYNRSEWGFHTKWFINCLWLCVAMLGLDISPVFIRRCADSIGWWVWPHVSQRLWESGEETPRRTTKTERTGATERNWGEREVCIHDFSIHLFRKCQFFLMTDARILETTLANIYMVSEYFV